jgi:ABC-type tungstate transport system permease subunit
MNKITKITKIIYNKQKNNCFNIYSFIDVNKKRKFTSTRQKDYSL